MAEFLFNMPELLDAPAASVRLKATIHDFLTEAAARSVRMQAVKKLCADDPEKGFEAILDLTVEDISPFGSAVVASAGIGKTTELIKGLKNFPGTVWFLIPHMKLASEIKKNCHAEGYQHVYTYRGRSSENCDRFDLTQELSRHVSPEEQSIGQALCKRGYLS